MYRKIRGALKIGFKIALQQLIYIICNRVFNFELEFKLN